MSTAIISAEVVVVPHADDLGLGKELGVSGGVLGHFEAFFDIVGGHWSEITWVVHVGYVSEPDEEIRVVICDCIEDVRGVGEDTVARTESHTDTIFAVNRQVELL